jgi:hypothetical protein
MSKFLYRASEARASLGCGVTKFYELINSGMLDARRFGRRTYITGASLEGFVETLKPIVTPTMAKTEQPQEIGLCCERQSPKSRFGSAAPRSTTTE